LVNYPAWTNPNYKVEYDNDIYVYAGFVPAGKHTFVMKDPVAMEYFSLQTVVSTKLTDHKIIEKVDALEQNGR